MKFLIDNQLPLKLRDYLNTKGFEASHVLDLKMDVASDRSIWAFARQNDFILVSKDEDFLQLSCLHSREVIVIHVAVGNCRNKALIEAFEKVLPQIIKSINHGDRVIEIY
ncbi:DUF5615 family PIN-like protein [Oscillatoria amoena NRMC-F 0135]|nr:DUF5615 family PIN-like protein [Oscillatoria laete-virens]MDL5049137.1 DUF5615 family PIN-like protein [Oscillatoria amoena NRMC-F 0135]MDL5052196.1 DUF5615 family PIN-like protein [Oscillatoria laete-virens NRMC-F 0139]